MQNLSMTRLIVAIVIALVLFVGLFRVGGIAWERIENYRMEKQRAEEEAEKEERRARILAAKARRIEDLLCTWLLTAEENFSGTPPFTSQDIQDLTTKELIEQIERSMHRRGKYMVLDVSPTGLNGWRAFRAIDKLDDTHRIEDYGFNERQAILLFFDSWITSGASQVPKRKGL